MSTFVACELLECRSLFAAAPVAGLDPAFLLDFAAVRKIAGKSTIVYDDAVPAAGDKTYLLAERHVQRVPNPDVDTGTIGLLTIARVTADGKLDPTFGTGGVALTMRLTEPRTNPAVDAPGLLKTDAAGRIYVADSSRVLRLRANGTIDKTFGNNGEAVFAGRGRTMALTDIAPTDDGVYVSTTDTTAGVEHFVVQKIDRRVRTVWSAGHDGSLSFAEEHGEGEFDGEPNGKRYFVPGAARFVVGRGGVMLAHVESDLVQDRRAANYYSATRQQLVVTRFDANGPADIARRDLRKGLFGYAQLNVAMQSGNGRTLLVQTTGEILRLNLPAGTAKRYDFAYGDSTQPTYKLLPDRSVYAITPAINLVDYHQATIERTALDGTPDPTFGNSGTVTLRLNKKTDAKNVYALGNLFLSISGRPYFLIDGYYGASSSLQRF